MNAGPGGNDDVILARRNDRPGATGRTRDRGIGCCSNNAGRGLRGRQECNPKRLEIFKLGLAELGYIEGKTIQIEFREAVLDADYHGVMAEMSIARST